MWIHMIVRRVRTVDVISGIRSNSNCESLGDRYFVYALPVMA